ncbi:MAG: hypothetical protein QM608_13730 [Caulobacter sp.]
MNGQTGKIVRHGASLAVLAIVLAACASSPFTPPPADPTSPLAAAADAAAHQRGKLPTFADIPQIPTDIPKPSEYKAQVQAEQAAAAQLKRDTAPETFALSDTDGFAARAQRAARVPPSEIPTAADRAETEAFAKAARGRATPPPSKPQ